MALNFFKTTMSQTNLLLRAALVAVSLQLATSAQAEERPRVALFATGGTIAGVQVAPGSAAYRPGVIPVADLLARLPELAEVAVLEAEQLANIASQDIDHGLWTRLSRRVAETLADPGVAGVVITHGTDTMEETAWWLRLTVATDKPIILTGAMLPATDPAADGPANLRAAVAAAASAEARGRGPLLLLNGQIHGARDVRKDATEALDAFASPNDGPVGRVVGGRPVFAASAAGVSAAPGGGFDVGAVAANGLPRVVVVAAHGDVDGAVVDALLALPPERRPQGLVLAGTGNGNASAALLAALQRASESGVVVVRASRTGRGLVNRNMEVDDDALGWVAARALSPQKARLLLALALTRTQDVAQIQRWFDES